MSYIKLREAKPKLEKPQKRLLHHIPLRFVYARVAGGGGKSVNMEIPLIPFIDFLITLVVFLLMSFSASGELVAQQATIHLPSADNTTQLEMSPVVSIDATVVTLDGRRIVDYPSLMTNGDASRIEALVEALELKKRQWEMLHPGQENPGIVIFSVDRDVDFRAMKKVMISVASAGFIHISFAVNSRGG